MHSYLGEKRYWLMSHASKLHYHYNRATPSNLSVTDPVLQARESPTASGDPLTAPRPACRLPDGCGGDGGRCDGSVEDCCIGWRWQVAVLR